MSSSWAPHAWAGSSLIGSIWSAMACPFYKNKNKKIQMKINQKNKIVKQSLIMRFIKNKVNNKIVVYYVVYQINKINNLCHYP